MQATQPPMTFEGSDEERQLAEQIFTLARFQGRFFPATAPIRLPREQLIGFLSSQRKGEDGAALGKAIDAALAQNAAIFAREETDDGVVTFVTTRGGTTPQPAEADLLHTLAKRFMDPEPLPPQPEAPPKKPAPMIAEGWSQRPVFPELFDEPENGEVDAVEAVAPTPGIPPLEPATAPTGGEDVMVAATPTAADTIAPMSSPAPLTPIEPVAPASTVDVSALPADTVRAALAARLEADDRFVSFGDRYFAEDMVDRYSRGDLRRIREYIVETNEPLGDDQLLQALFNRRPNDPTYEAARFSINYRLSKEKREFEFTGTRDSRLWSTAGLAPLGTTLRKASELGTDYRFLLDEDGTGETGSSVTHTLTFFEWVYGLLPLDGTLRDFFPQPYLEDQKTATIRFEVPQLYATFLAELRYPTGNRGGYLVGFDEFYRENVVPGAILTIERTPNNDGQFVIRYTAATAREERVLQIDERRNRYVFRPQTVSQDTDDAWLLSETRYPRLNNIKPLDDRERRRIDIVIGTAFERVAENVGTKAAPRYWSAPEELLPVVNIERPFSLRSLREALESPQYQQFSADPDTRARSSTSRPRRKRRGAARSARLATRTTRTWKPRTTNSKGSGDRRGNPRRSPLCRDYARETDRCHITMTMNRRRDRN